MTTILEPKFRCFELAQKYESFSENSYIDTDGLPHIGYGTYAQAGETTISWPVGCFRLASEILGEWHLFCKICHANLIDLSWLTQGNVDALADLVYNVGADAAIYKTRNDGIVRARLKTDLIELIRDRNVEGVAANLLLWNHAKGKENLNLTMRCKARAKLWNT